MKNRLPSTSRYLQIVSLLAATFVALSAIESLQANTICMAETNSGKVVTLEMKSVGSLGSFSEATLTITDKNGETILTEKFPDAGQFTSQIFRGKGLVVFWSTTSDVEVHLTFFGKDQDTDNLKPILKDPNRKAEKGNQLEVWVYTDDEPQQYSFKDIVCTISKDV